MRSLPLFRPTVCRRSVPHFSGVARQIPRRPPVSRTMARCTAHAIRMNQFGGSRPGLPRASAISVTSLRAAFMSLVDLALMRAGVMLEARGRRRDPPDGNRPELFGCAERIKVGLDEGR